MDDVIHVHVPDEPMTKRERFAMAAMQAFISSLGEDSSIVSGKGKKDALSAISKVSVEMADALLKELEK